MTILQKIEAYLTIPTLFPHDPIVDQFLEWFMQNSVPVCRESYSLRLAGKDRVFSLFHDPDSLHSWSLCYSTYPDDEYKPMWRDVRPSRRMHCKFFEWLEGFNPDLVIPHSEYEAKMAVAAREKAFAELQNMESQK